jgi:hypothetical protein
MTQVKISYCGDGYRTDATFSAGMAVFWNLPSDAQMLNARITRQHQRDLEHTHRLESQLAAYRTNLTRAMAKSRHSPGNLNMP